MREGYSTVSIVWGYVEPLPDKQKLTERSEDYVILPKEELHPKQKEAQLIGVPIKFETPKYDGPGSTKCL